ncbi:MAG: hypothetical protein U0T32_05320 [Chitinophagales bacterium]
MKKIIALVCIVAAAFQLNAMQQKATVQANNKGASVKGSSGGGVAVEKRHVEAKGKSGNGVDVNKKGMEVKGTKGGMNIDKKGLHIQSKRLNVQIGK